MCGINGVLHKGLRTKESIEQQLQLMNSLIVHRGPDSDGQFGHCSETFSVGMAMRRLSIIDLSSGDQPMYSEDGSIAIVFNGEIYNYPEIKTRLQHSGVRFHTNSDTEVILKLYETLGTDGFSQLDGMFAFSITDLSKQKLYICRDYFGEKPLYYYRDNQSFYWASELKSIQPLLNHRPQISIHALNLFFRLTYIPAPYSIYEEVYKLEPNTILTIDLGNLELNQTSLYTETTIPTTKIRLKDASERTRQLVYDSVVSRSISDVPIGTFLSGGVDSSIISWCLADYKHDKINTFSIGFDTKGYDETEKSRQVAKLIGSNHHEYIVNEQEMERSITEILLNFDEPFADSSALPTYLVANKTSSKVKVALTGDGGDEIFGGYNKYYIGQLNNTYIKAVPKVFHSMFLKMSDTLLRQKSDVRQGKYRIKRLLESIDYDNNHYWDIISLGMSNADLQSYLNPLQIQSNLFDYYKHKTGISHPNSLHEFRQIDKCISLEGDMLVKVDRTSMLNSLECRAPFLNKALFDFSLSLPEDYLMKGYNKKYILKDAFKEMFPKGFLDKPKSGFGIPIGNWLRNSLKDELLSYIEPSKLEAQNIFNVDEVTHLIKNHANGKIDNSFKVWSFYCFQKWYYNVYVRD